ncbi:MAG: hypothetical protein V3U88_12870 [Methylococcales bacterium]
MIKCSATCSDDDIAGLGEMLIHVVFNKGNVLWRHYLMVIDT